MGAGTNETMLNVGVLQLSAVVTPNNAAFAAERGPTAKNAGTVQLTRFTLALATVIVGSTLSTPAAITAAKSADSNDNSVVGSTIMTRTSTLPAARPVTGGIGPPGGTDEGETPKRTVPAEL